MTIRPLFRALFPVAVLLASAPALVAREGRDGSDAVRDPRVLEMLTAANLRFTADKDGDAIVRFRVGSGEEQTVTVVSSTARLRDLEMRDAYAVAVTGSGKTPDDLFEDLLLRNEESDFGAWEWVGSEKTDDRDWAVAFRVKIPARHRETRLPSRRLRREGPHPRAARRVTIQNKPPGSAMPGPGAWKKTLAARYSPAADCRSTLATGALHFRVRNGNGCRLPAMATKEKRNGRRGSGQPGRADGSEAKCGEGKNAQASRTISTGRVSASPRLRLRPIEAVVFRRP